METELIQVILAGGGAFLLGVGAVLGAIKGSRKKSENAAVDIVDSTSSIIQKLVDGHTTAINLISARVDQQRKDLNELEDIVKELKEVDKQMMTDLKEILANQSKEVA